MAIVIGTLVLFFTSFLWFNEKTFFPIWWRLMGKTGQPGDKTVPMPALFASAFLACVIQAFTLKMLFSWKGDVTAIDGLMIGAAVGFGIAATSALGHRLFAGDGFKVWAIEVGADITGLALAGAAMTFFI